MITDGVDGLLVKPRTEDNLAAAIMRVIEDEPLRRHLALRRPGDRQALRHRRHRRPVGGADGRPAGPAHPRQASGPDSSTGSAMTSTSAPLR
ncbi:hypothetical protein ACFSTC_29555 [Nonomuraea ferruginea]